MVAFTPNITPYAQDETVVEPLTPRALLFGLNESELHERFWSARGVVVVRAGDFTNNPVAKGAELYLLTDATTLVLFRMRLLVDLLSWSRPGVLYVRIRSARARAYWETAITNRIGRFMRFERGYDARRLGLARVALTSDVEVARQWQSMPSPRAAWQMLRRTARTIGREAATIDARVYDGSSDADAVEYVRDLARFWKHPDSTIPGLRSVAPAVWAHDSAVVAKETKFIGPAWIGAGRNTDKSAVMLGPTMLWDSLQSQQRVGTTAPEWHDIEPRESFRRPHVRPGTSAARENMLKRGFDIAFSILALVLMTPVLLFVMAAILIEDGRPLFFVHRREGRGAREFGCIKFRSMRKDADVIKAKLALQNEADGPQFFIESDPRVTRVGRIIRKLNLDEVPQFVNVLLGHMSVVGPRPSPYAENQYCPSWREARLSVRPGITGLWQVSRTRKRGLDFQEWIKFDLQYVERHGLACDAKIILQTVLMLIGKNRS